MSVLITVNGADKGSDEYISSIKLKRMLESSLDNSTMGEIILFANAQLVGQEVKDVDILMIGQLMNCCGKYDFTDANGDVVSGDINIASFCTTVEVKSHSITGVRRQGTDYYVKYNQKWHCATTQSSKQKISAMNFFLRSITLSPYITNIIWFNSISENDLNKLSSDDNGHLIPSNVLPAEFDFAYLAQRLIWQTKAFKNRKSYWIDANYNGMQVGDFAKALNLFSKLQAAMGELTRKRIEQIANKELPKKSLINENNTISILRGRAGTGKTVALLKQAIKIIDENEYRVLMLTFNRALVSDIRRTLALADLPDMFNESCLAIMTMHSFFYKIAKAVLLEDSLSGEKFIDEYEEILKDILSVLSDDDQDFINDIKSSNIQIDWDYVLIDEAQDWNEDESAIIIKLFKKGHILVADGGQQIVRANSKYDWSSIRDKKSEKLKLCLRQKNNLIRFINKFMDGYGGPNNPIRGSGEMLGGRVIITTKDYLETGIHNDEIKYLHDLGNVNYDMLFLIPPSLVNHEENEFKYKEKYELEGIFFWNGIQQNKRTEYPIDADEIRLLQYDSSRGLEAWTVVCLDFDDFLAYKEKQYVDNGDSSLILESAEERKIKYLLNWALIPLTRAIDTVIITIKNPDSEIGKILLKIAKESNDYVSLY